MTLSLEQAKGYALELQNNPLLGDLLKDMEDAALIAWRGAQKHDIDAREQAWNETQAILKLRRSIESVIQRALEAENETEDGAL